MYIDTAIVTHTRLTTITCMRTFCSILPVGSRSRLRSYNDHTTTCGLRLRFLPALRRLDYRIVHDWGARVHVINSEVD